MSGGEGAGKTGGAGDWLYIYCDGASRGNPGPAGIGGQVRDSGGGLLLEVCKFLGETTNNVAEYHALIATLEAGKRLGYGRVKIRTDSELLANQVTGGFRVKSKELRPLYQRVKALLEGFGAVEVEHIRREKNIACDALANRAIDDGLSGAKQPLLGPGDEGLF